jgi:hypothetical protein
MSLSAIEPISHHQSLRRSGGTSGPQALTELVKVPAAPQQVLIAHTLSAGQSAVDEHGNSQVLGVAQAPVPSDVWAQKQAEFGLQSKV